MNRFSTAFGIAALVLLASGGQANAIPYHVTPPTLSDERKQPSIHVTCIQLNGGKIDIYKYHYPPGFIEHIGSLNYSTKRDISKLLAFFEFPECDKMDYFRSR